MMAQKNECSKLKSKGRLAKAKQAIKAVESGVVIVEFANYRKQIAYYDKTLAQSDLSSKTRKNLEKRRSEWKSDNESWIIAVMNAFQENYELGEVRYVLRSARGKYDDVNAEIWLNEDLELQTMPAIGEHKYVMLSQGTTTNQGLKAYLFLDEKLKSMCSPLPAYFRLNNWRALFIFGDEETKFKAQNLVNNFQASILKAQEDLSS